MQLTTSSNDTTNRLGKIVLLAVVIAAINSPLFIGPACADAEDCSKVPCIGTLPRWRTDCMSYGDSLYARQRKGELVRIHFQQMNNGSNQPWAAEHVANLIDSDFTFFFEPASEIREPAQDISKLRRVAPLGDALLDQFETLEVVGGTKMRPTTVFGLPDRAVSKVREGGFELERFSRTIGGITRPFNIVSISFPGNAGGTGKVDAFLRKMRGLVNFTDEQMHSYGVQLALRDDSMCRTLSYAPDSKGKVGLLYSDGFGNFATDDYNKSQVVAYGESALRRIWHTLRASAKGKVEFQVSMDTDSVGLVSVLEEDFTMISKSVIFDSVIDRFEPTDHKALPFREVARRCTELIGLKNYDDYQKRGDGRFPAYYDALMRCMEEAHYVKKANSVYSPIRTKLTLTSADGQSNEYYVRKFSNKLENTFDRYKAIDLVAAMSECSDAAADIKSILVCLNNRNYQVISRESIKPRQMFRVATEAESASIRAKAVRHEKVMVQPKVLKMEGFQNGR